MNGESRFTPRSPGCFFNRPIRSGNSRLSALRFDRLLAVGGVLIVRYRAEPIESYRCKIRDRYLECVLNPLPRTEAYPEYDRPSEWPHQTRIGSADGRDISAACKTAEEGQLFWKRSEWRTHQAPWDPRGAVEHSGIERSCKRSRQRQRPFLRTIIRGVHRRTFTSADIRFHRPARNLQLDQPPKPGAHRRVHQTEACARRTSLHFVQCPAGMVAADAVPTLADRSCGDPVRTDGGAR